MDMTVKLNIPLNTTIYIDEITVTPSTWLERLLLKLRLIPYRVTLELPGSCSITQYVGHQPHQDWDKIVDQDNHHHRR